MELCFQGAEANVEDQNLRGDQRQCGQDAGVDGTNCDAGAEVPAIEIDILLVVVDADGVAAAAILLLPRSVGVAERSVCGRAGAGRSARRCASTCHHVVGQVDSRNPSKKQHLISGGGWHGNSDSSAARPR